MEVTVEGLSSAPVLLVIDDFIPTTRVGNRWIQQGSTVAGVNMFTEQSTLRLDGQVASLPKASLATAFLTTALLEMLCPNRALLAPAVRLTLCSRFKASELGKCSLIPAQPKSSSSHQKPLRAPGASSDNEPEKSRH